MLKPLSNKNEKKKKNEDEKNPLYTPNHFVFYYPSLTSDRSF